MFYLRSLFLTNPGPEGRSGKILSCRARNGVVPVSWLKSTTNWESIEPRTSAVELTTTAESISASLEEDSDISTSDLTRSRIADAIGGLSFVFFIFAGCFEFGAILNFDGALIELGIAREFGSVGKV